MLTPTLRSPSDLLNKLDRELWRAFHHRHLSHKADHFYNFCVTALAAKDHFFEAKGIIDSSQKAPYYLLWNKVAELVAATEIANSTKHFVLRDGGTKRTAKTRSVTSSTSSVVHMFVNSDGEHKLVREPDAPDFYVELSDGTIQGLYEFMDVVSKYWRGFLTSEGIAVVPQSPTELYGTET